MSAYEFYNLPLTPEALEAWLCSKRPDAWVGYPGREDRCPLATYIEEQLSLEEELHVNGASISYIDDQDYPHSRVTPGWAKDFIGRIDELGKEDGVEDVTAQQALATLAWVTRVLTIRPNENPSEKQL